MTLQQVVLAVLLSLPPWYEDRKKETQEAREARLTIISEAIVKAADRATCHEDPSEKCKPKWTAGRESLAIMLVNLAWWESRLALHVHQNRCRVLIGECDAGRARSIWQLQISRQVEWERWSKIAGTSKAATEEAAAAAADVLSMAHARCKTLTGAISMYATGRSCKWKRAPERLRHYERLMDKAKQARDEYEKPKEE